MPVLNIKHLTFKFLLEKHRKQNYLELDFPVQKLGRPKTIYNYYHLQNTVNSQHNL